MAHTLKPYFAWSYFFSAQADVFIVYPWAPTHVLVEDQGHRSMRKAINSWLDYDVFKLGQQHRNPRHEAYWVAPYVDAGGKGLMVSHAAPIMAADGRFRGIVGTDLLMNTLQTLTQGWQGDKGRWWVATQPGELLSDSGQALFSNPKDAQVPALASRLPQGVHMDDVLRAAAMDGAASPVQGGVLFAHASRHAPWLLIHYVSDATIASALLPQLMPFAQMTLVVVVAFLIGQHLIQMQVMNPTLAILNYLLRRMRHGRAAEPAVHRLWQPLLDTIVRNLDAQRDIQQQQRRSEAFKSAVVDNALFAIVTTDEAGTIVEFNPAAEQMFEVPRASALGKLVSDVVVPPKYRQAHLEGLARLKQGAKPRVIGRRVEMEAQRADGSLVPVEMVLVRSEIDGEVFYNALLSDLSERRRVTDENERQREALRQSEKLTAMGSLLAGVAHELNNPLAILMGRASLLEDKSTDPALRADAQRIREAAERCGRIVRTFLNMARNHRGERQVVRLNDMVRGAVDLLAYSLRTSGVDVRLNLASDLPAVVADSDQIGQVILNLLVNAQQAPGVSCIDITTAGVAGLDGCPRHVRLTMQDNGGGISPELAQRVFDPFFTTKPVGSGTGLGLSMSRGIARDHGGDLTLAAPRPGEGAMFMLSLPAQATARAGETPLDGPSTNEDGQGFLARILVVDDELELADVMRAMLENQGYEVLSAESGQVALELLAEAPCDLMLSDLRMPGMDGPALWREIAQRHPQLARRVVFVTGDTLSAGADEFLRETGCACIEKPFTQAELLAKVQAGLRRGPGVGQNN